MSQQIVQEYIHRMNTADVEGLLELMTPDHVFFVNGDSPSLWHRGAARGVERLLRGVSYLHHLRQ